MQRHHLPRFFSISKSWPKVKNTKTIFQFLLSTLDRFWVLQIIIAFDFRTGLVHALWNLLPIVLIKPIEKCYSSNKNSKKYSFAHQHHDCCNNMGRDLDTSSQEGCDSERKLVEQNVVIVRKHGWKPPSSLSLIFLHIDQCRNVCFSFTLE